MESLYLLTDKALDELKSTVRIEKYNNSTNFIEEQFAGRQYRSSIDRSVELPDLYVKSKDEEPMWLQDFNNAITLHKAINSNTVPLRYLVDERFWSYLAHTKYWTYLQNRWPADNEDRIKRNYFFAGGSQVFSRHALVRLWWRVECSYNSQLSDPYELTRIAFDFADPVNQIIERKISKSRKVFRCALIALRDVPNSNKLKSSENRMEFGKAINSLAGIKLIEVMKEEEIIEMFKEQIRYIVDK